MLVLNRPRRELFLQSAVMIAQTLMNIERSHLNDSSPPRKETLRCFFRYGCFSIEDPWVNELRPVALFPLSPTKISARYYWFARNINGSQEISEDLLRKGEPKELNKNLKFIIIIHGYMDLTEGGWVEEMKDELLKQGDYNVIAYDWHGGSGPPYAQAVANTRIVGAILGHFILKLQKLLMIDPGSCHIVGHSLGAHVGGYAGKYVRKRNSSIGRITGLDPAKPYFEDTEPIVRLHHEDAEFVDVIHTDIGPMFKAGLGIRHSLGHLDFYPNGGSYQPGCAKNIQESMQNKFGSVLSGIRHLVSCSHLRAYRLFIDSINSECRLMAHQCEDYDSFMRSDCLNCSDLGSKCAEMGFHADNYKHLADPLHGSYYSLTTDTEPFCTEYMEIALIISAVGPTVDTSGVFTVRVFKSDGTDESTYSTKLKEIGRQKRFVFLSPIFTINNGTSVEIIWIPQSSPFDFLRLKNEPILYVENLTITTVSSQQEWTFATGNNPLTAKIPLKLDISV